MSLPHSFYIYKPEFFCKEDLYLLFNLFIYAILCISSISWIFILEYITLAHVSCSLSLLRLSWTHLHSWRIFVCLMYDSESLFLPLLKNNEAFTFSLLGSWCNTYSHFSFFLGKGSFLLVSRFFSLSLFFKNLIIMFFGMHLFGFILFGVH